VDQGITRKRCADAERKLPKPQTGSRARASTADCIKKGNAMIAAYIVKQYERAVVFKLGKVDEEARGRGMFFVVPFVQETRIRRVSLRIVTMPIQSQGIITKDTVSIDVSAVAYYRGEALAADQLAQAADVMVAHPIALQLRNLQTLVEVAVDKNSTVVFPAPLMSTIAELGAFLDREGKAARALPAPELTTGSTNGELVPHDRHQST
jgi:SPFH domain / Band 7 family